MRSVEELVARFFELREGDPGLQPAAFVAEHAEHGEELLAAIEHLLETLQRFEPLAPEGTARRIGEYELVRELGRGGMGVVFEARRVGEPTAEPVAVKILPLGCLVGDRALSRFEREVRTLERLDHPQGDKRF